MEGSRDLFGVTFQNPVMLAAGTCGFGREVAGVIDLESLGGLVTKSVTVEPREGNPAPRIAEIGAGMLNSIGLANPGIERVRSEKLPWLRDHLKKAHVLVSVAGHRPGEYFRVVEALDDEDGFLGFELNLSCPNDQQLSGLPFAHDPNALKEVVAGVRSRTERPVVVKLAPNAPDPGSDAKIVEEEGADGVTLVNTMPALAYHDGSNRPVLGAGSGGLSGPPLRGIGVKAVKRVWSEVELPVIGVGGIRTLNHALQYLTAGASLIQIGSATFADPRTAMRVAKGLGRGSSGRSLGWLER